MQHMRVMVSPKTLQEVAERTVFENQISHAIENNPESEKDFWQQYLVYEQKTKHNPQRAKILYERAI